jgi:hypothetical protein
LIAARARITWATRQKASQLAVERLFFMSRR